MLVNLIQIKILHFLIAARTPVQGTLQRKKLTASFTEHFKEIHENAICVYFQFSYSKIKSREVFHALCMLYRAI